MTILTNQMNVTSDGIMKAYYLLGQFPSALAWIVMHEQLIQSVLSEKASGKSVRLKFPFSKCQKCFFLVPSPYTAQMKMGIKNTNFCLLCTSSLYNKKM